MKCQSKISITGTSPEGSLSNMLVRGNMYECSPVPSYHIGGEIKSEYVVICEDGRYRRYDTDNFYTIEEMREVKLRGIGI